MSDHTTNNNIKIKDIHKPDYPQKLATKYNRLFNAESTFIPNNSIFKTPQDETLSIKQRAKIFFKDIIGNEKIKTNLYRSLLYDNRIINILLIGKPATSKTMLCNAIEQQCNDVIFYDASAGSTGAGLFETLRLNRRAKILIIDEISELRKNDIDMLRGLLNNGRVSKTLKTDRINFFMHGLKVFATTNNPTKLSIPIKSRFQIYLIEGYSNEEFIDVMVFCLLKQNIVKTEEMAKELAYAMLHYDVKNVRTALSICSLVHEDDKHEDIKEIIETYIANDGSKLNINYNEEY
jgi:Holliday junction DNA helicase RuvB